MKDFYLFLCLSYVCFNIEIPGSSGIFIRLWENGVREPDIGKSERGVQISSRKIRKERALAASLPTEIILFLIFEV